MKKPIILSNSLYHVLVYGYFQHGYEIWYAMQKNIQDYSYSDLLLQRQMFESIRGSLRGFQTMYAPTPISGIAAMLGSGKSYPKVIYLTDGECIFYNQIISLKFEQMEKFLKRYYRLNKTKMPKDAFSELVTNLRTPEAINFLMDKFRIEKKLVIA